MRRLIPLAFLLVACAKPSGSPTPSSISRSTTAISKSPGRYGPYEEVRLDEAHRLWVYTPKGAKGKLPCVVIAPAGAHMFDGMDLGEGDVPEHLPYLKAGYVVVAYDVSGPLKGKDEDAIAEAAKAFMAADAGVADGKRAIDYAIQSLNVDPARIATAGHSSSGTIALAVAENDPRVKACLAYAPIVDVAGDLRTSLPDLESLVPGLTTALVRNSPLGGAANLKCPTLLFHAKDDTNAPLGPIANLAAAISEVKLVEVPEGGHYDSMIAKGIPAGLAFLKSHGLGP